MYAIQKLFVDIMKEKKIKKSEIAKKLGYKNISKGCRRIDEFLKSLDASAFDIIIEKMPGLFNISCELVEEKLKETAGELDRERLLREEEERKNFVPYLYCQTERSRPSPIFVCVFTGAIGRRYLHLPSNYNDLSTCDQENFRKELINWIVEKRGGTIPSFGKITCFTLRRYYDDEESEREVYDLEGELIEGCGDEFKVIIKGKASLRVGGQDITKFCDKRI